MEKTQASSNQVCQEVLITLCKNENQGPVVQSMVSLMSSLRGQLLKSFMTL